MIQTKVSIEGMACGMCEAHINAAVRRAFRIRKIHSSHRNGQAIIISDNRMDEEKLCEVIGSLGYPVLLIEETQMH